MQSLDTCGAARERLRTNPARNASARGPGDFEIDREIKMDSALADPIEPTAARSSASPAVTPSERLISLDALRGFDMFFILGFEQLTEAIGEAVNNPATRLLAKQMRHSPWEGFRFIDLIFPMFVFIAGVSLVFSLSKTIARGGKSAAVRRIVLRTIVLFLLGIIYNGGMTQAWPHVRIMGVLQRISLAYLAAGLLFTFFGWRTLLGTTLGLLLLYWGLIALVKAPGESSVSFAEGHNIADYLDRRFLPGHRYVKNDHDPEGILSTLPAVATCLLGVFAGMLLRNRSTAPWKKAAILCLAGAAGVSLGMAWGGMVPGIHTPAVLTHLRFPVIKKIWTSSFVLVAGGYSTLLLGAFYLVVDLWKLRFWARPFIWIGSNAIALYMAENLFRFDKLADRFVGGSVAHQFGRWAPVVSASLAVLLVLLLARFLYRRQIFIRV